jgi:hypothetical protein
MLDYLNEKEFLPTLSYFTGGLPAIFKYERIKIIHTLSK